MPPTPAVTFSSITIPLPDQPSPLSILYHRPSHPSSTAPTLLFLPFWGGSASTYTSLRTSLAVKSPDTISVAVSYPGTGTPCAKLNAEKDNDDNDPSDHSIPSLASSVLTALSTPSLRSLIPSGKVTVVAHSMSAKIAYELMAALIVPHSDQTNSSIPISVTGLHLLAPAPPTPLVLPEEMRSQQLTAYSSFESARWTIANILTHKKLDGEVLDALANDAAGMSQGATRGWIEIGMSHNCALSMKKVSEAQGQVPVRVLVGNQDQVETVSRVQMETVNALQAMGWDASMRVIDGVGHLLPVEAVDEVVGQVLEMIQ